MKIKIQINADMRMRIVFHVFVQLNHQPNNTGKTGSTQGASTESMPAKNDTRIMIVICINYVHKCYNIYRYL